MLKCVGGVDHPPQLVQEMRVDLVDLILFSHA
jgi:hypothetical protein